MYIGIDARALTDTQPTGKGQWTRGFIRELCTREFPLTLFVSEELSADWKDVVRAVGAHVTVFKRPVTGLRWHWQVAQAVAEQNDMIYISPLSYIVPCLLGRSARHVPIVHDLIAFQPGAHDRKAMLVERCTLRRAVQTSFLTCTISNATKEDLHRRFPYVSSERVVPMYAGVNEQSQAYMPIAGNILCIATLSPRKNQRRLIEAFASLPHEVRKGATLTLVGGRGWKDSDIVSLAHATPGVILAGYVAEEERRRMLAHAHILAFPSLYEGFGLPVLEAMKQGVPVLTSSRGSLREVAGDAALIVDPEDVVSIRHGLQTLLTDASLCDRLREQGIKHAAMYSWQRTVNLCIDALNTAIRA